MGSHYNNAYYLNSSVIYLIYNYIFLKQHDVYIFDKSNSKFTTNKEISSLTISGSNNKIIFRNEVVNLIINGSSNKINATHKKCFISNVVFNGSNNKIEVNQDNQNINNFQNGTNNIIFTKKNHRSIILNDNKNNNNNNKKKKTIKYKGKNITITMGGNNKKISKNKILNIIIYLQVTNK